MPTSLTISPNGSTVNVYPNMGYDDGILYQLSESAAAMRVSVPIPLQDPDSIIFIQCQINTTFTIGKVLYFTLLYTHFTTTIIGCFQTHVFLKATVKKQIIPCILLGYGRFQEDVVLQQSM